MLLLYSYINSRINVIHVQHQAAVDPIQNYIVTSKF